MLAALAMPATASNLPSGSEGTNESEKGSVELDRLLSTMIAEGDIEVSLGGRIQFDIGGTSSDQTLKDMGHLSTDGAEFRRVRLFAKGSIYKAVEFKAQFEFSSGSVALKDVYGRVKTPVGKLTVGHFKEPFGLDELISSKHQPIIEPSTTIAFAGSRNAGVMLSDSVKDANVTWALGVFADTDNQGRTNNGTVDDGDGRENGSYNVTGRLTYAPLHDEEAGKLAHFGVALSKRGDVQGETEFSSRGGSHFTDKLAKATVADSTGAIILGVESAWTQGPASLQAEYVMTEVDSEATDYNFGGYYLTASYFLTGEHRPYKDGVFGRLKPFKNYGDGGNGAFEVAARYDVLDLSDSGLYGGELTSVAGGVNWYLNPNARVQLFYTTTDVDDGSTTGTSNAVTMRFALDW